MMHCSDPCFIEFNYPWINHIICSHFSSESYNLLLMACKKAQTLDLEEFFIPLDELRLILGDTECSEAELTKKVLFPSMRDLQFCTTGSVDTKKFYTHFNLFSRLGYKPDKHLLVVWYNISFSFLVDDLLKNYSDLDLLHIMSFDSKYSKGLFRLLKLKEGEDCTYKADELRYHLGIPKEVKDDKIYDEYIKDCIDELNRENCFKNLHCNVNTVDDELTYTFIFKPIKDLEWDEHPTEHFLNSKSAERKAMIDGWKNYHPTKKELDEAMTIDIPAPISEHIEFIKRKPVKMPSPKKKTKKRAAKKKATA